MTNLYGRMFCQTGGSNLNRLNTRQMQNRPSNAECFSTCTSLKKSSAPTYKTTKWTININITFLITDYKQATSWENLFLPHGNNKGADQPAHPRSLISAFVIRCLDSIIRLVSISEISSLYIASVAVQAGLSLPWSQTPEDKFSRDVAQTRART